MAASYYVYMLRCADDSLYTGYTTDLESRLQKHESGKGAKYTRGRGPFVLEYSHTYASKTEALQEEYRLKKLSRAKKEQWIAEKGEEPDVDPKEF
ncbi:GIY-YIG nuclease family protein [Halobacillus rhizosphaerae]|uniref:GIY-YIG nuclease family protein n=1 Tax=Halobacillus rhizosphaerae TaxID=3064889 RepID=UPI00398B62A0